jgi:ZIP family zinc transporter
LKHFFWWAATAMALVVAAAGCVLADDGEYREIRWEYLLPADWDAKTAFAQLDLDALTDDDPVAQQALQDYLEQGENAPVNPALEGERVRLRGFVVPLEWENATEIREFLLVPYFGACIHVPPPPPNQTVSVRLEHPRKDIRSMDVLRVYGVMRLEQRSSNMGASGYRLDADRLEPDAQTDTPSVIRGLGVALLAGLSTGLGALLAISRKNFSTRLLCLSLGLAAGLMLAFSLTIAANWFIAPHPPWESISAFFAVILLMAGMERAMPDSACAGCGELHHADTQAGHVHTPRHAGKLTAFAMAVHNFPEGFAVFSAAMADPGMGVALGGAVAAHNIPLGVAIALPLYHSFRNRRLAFLYALLAGLTQPAGALLGYFALRSVLTPTVQEILFACAGGIMASVAVGELIPAARRYGGHKIGIGGLCAGMALMGAVLLLFPHT